MSTDLRLLEQRNGVSFMACLAEAIHSELVTEWQRLSGKKLIATRSLDRRIDEATGYDMAVMHEFADFVYEYVFKLF
jgi:hypothetical protein